MANSAIISISRRFIIGPFLCKIYSSSRQNSLRFVTVPKSWQTEKEALLSLSKKEKREVMKDFVSLEEVQKWPEYSANIAPKKTPTDEDKELFINTAIDATLNKSLANKVSIYRGDITKLEVDAIVNAANSKLLGGGGVDGAIHRAAGPLLLEECRQLNGCTTGDAKITGGYELPAKYVIHTVGPQDKSTSKLQSCYKNCFSLQLENKLTSIAFPCVSTGIYGFPNRLAAHIALSTARNALEKDARAGNILERVVFCTFLPVDVEIYETLLQLYFPFE